VKKLKFKKVCSPRPHCGREAGGEEVAVLSQPTLLFLHRACLFGLSPGIATACTTLSLLASLPLAGARGTETFNFFTALGAGERL
jgi:hypothetical protein